MARFLHVAIATYRASWRISSAKHISSKQRLHIEICKTNYIQGGIRMKWLKDYLSGIRRNPQEHLFILLLPCMCASVCLIVIGIMKLLK